MIYPQYAGLHVMDYDTLYFKATDNGSSNFDNDEFFFDERNYYPNLEIYGLDEYGKIADPGKPVIVKPMLAMDAEQQRLPEDDGRDVL